MAITAAREARRLIPSKVATSDFGILALFNLEGTLFCIPVGMGP